jgi:threonylcarbamoyladenosine tRNA methylthiotransferase MtaB
LHSISKKAPPCRTALNPLRFTKPLRILESANSSPVEQIRRKKMPTFFIEQFGCRATQADGAALERQLLSRGCAVAPEAAAADIVVFNTCTVTAAADAQARESIRKIHAQNPAAHLIVTGCYAQRAPEELAALPGVSWVIGNSHKTQIPQLLEIPLSTRTNGTPVGDAFVPAATLDSDPLSLLHAPPKILTGNIFEQDAFLAAPVFGGEGNHTRPTLKVQDGCNSRCSYCVIPFVRGKSRSLPPDQVIAEIQRLTVGQTLLSVSEDRADQCSGSDYGNGCELPQAGQHNQGAREIVLSGINLGTYGRDLSPRVEFIDLLRRILDETSIERLRISSVEPLDVTQDLIALFASTDRIAQHFHMPLQSGSDRILGAMHRWYRAEHYARRIELIREHLPHAAIGADVIAGFPGETQAEHDATVAFIERLPFSYLHVFSFSSRPGTRAEKLPDHLPPEIVKQRSRELRAVGQAKATAFRRSQIGRTLRVLTLRRDADDIATRSTPALSSNYLRVTVRGSFRANTWINALVTSNEDNSLLGEPQT